jgi:hypothetical protein
MWRNIAKKHDVPMVVIEVVCSDEALHKRRVDSRVRSIEGMPEVVWERVLERKKEFEPWKEPHLVLDSVEERDVLLRKALEYAR